MRKNTQGRKRVRNVLFLLVVIAVGVAPAILTSKIGYGFSPLKLDADFDFMAMFHGVDERVPVEGLAFGARVLKEFLENA